MPFSYGTQLQLKPNLPSKKLKQQTTNKHTNIPITYKQQTKNKQQKIKNICNACITFKTNVK